MKEKIILLAGQKFGKTGFYKTTIDEIASEMKISKKTIYKHFTSKDALIKAVIDDIRYPIAESIGKIVDGSENVVIKLYKISDVLSSQIPKISLMFLEELRINMPDLWNEIYEFRKTTIQKNFSRLIEQGKNEELIVDKPSAIILTIVISSIQAVVNPEFILNNNLSIRSAVTHTLDVVFSGILTKTGRKIFKEFKSGNQNE
ncbi:MAG: TetR/AcrR family transcriptional regulator [Melioribacteraceae bacterium]|nr:MAG: TetR/AcrR family transcriptional regulator [Melioribacteraceae bacterium]